MVDFITNEEEPTIETVEPYVPPTVQEPLAEPLTPETDTTVSGQLTGILAKESPYIQAARERGKQYAHRRGLLSSSIAAGAAEKSAIEAALPIAQQDAGTVAQKELVGVQEAASSRLSEQEATQSQALEAQQQEGANYRQDKEIALKESLSLADVSLSEKNAIASHMTALGDNFQAKLAGIQVDPNISSGAKTAAITSLQNAYEANLQSLGSIYGVEISWDIAA